MIDELKQLNDTFYKIFEELKEAKPSLEGCDAAFLSMSQKITDQYELEYRLLDLKCRIETEKKIAELEALYERLVPQKWYRRIFLFFKKEEQNHAADYVDLEADERESTVFAKTRVKLAELVAERVAAEQLAEEAQARLSVTLQRTEGEKGDEGAEGVSDGDSEGVEAPKAQEPEKPAESAADKAMREYRNKTKKKQKNQNE